MQINARIWEVDPRLAGFAMCMVDYRFNIQKERQGHAPFNFWPYSLKFQLMNPLLIYHAVIRANDDIETRIFPGERGSPTPVDIMPFPRMSRLNRNLTTDMLRQLAAMESVQVAQNAPRKSCRRNWKQRARIATGRISG